MASYKDFFKSGGIAEVKGVAQKSILTKRAIISHMAVRGECTLAELAKECGVSIPTITKLMEDLVGDGVAIDVGKVETAGGRRPNIYALSPTAVYFAGAEVANDFLHYTVTDINNKLLAERLDEAFELEDTPECLDRICTGINGFMDSCGVERDKIVGLGVCIAGRVNPPAGHSYLYFASVGKPLRDILSESTGVDVSIENDTRARCYAEYVSDKLSADRNVLYLHLGRTVAVGIIIDGKLYYGKSGFAGEFGHTPLFNNEKICVCGKKGCLETEISGSAIEEQAVNEIRGGINTLLKERYEAGESIRIEDVINAAGRNDDLSIELVEAAGEKAGKSLSFLINLFNPETVIIGGILSGAGDYLMLPLQSAANKYSLNLIYKDARFKLSSLGSYSGSLGAAMLARSYVIGI